MHKIIYMLLTAFVFATGWYSHYFIKGADTNSYHWKKLSEFREHIESPDNTSSSDGFSSTSLPFDNIPHLEALVSTGELDKREVIIPNLPVSKELTLSWMKFSNSPLVLEARAQGKYYHGEIPLSFTVYYKPAFKDELDQYVDELNKMANKSK